MKLTERASQRLAGILFLAAFVAYGFGTTLVAPLMDAPDSTAAVQQGSTKLVIGCLLMLANSAIVMGIGLLLRSTLASASKNVANLYLATRVVEGLFLAAGVFALLSLAFTGDAVSLSHVTFARRANFIGYQVGMLALGLGSLPFCRLLLQEHLAPRWLAGWGFMGYAVFATGALLELLGLSYGLALSIPGGIFELALGVWLMTKGLGLPRNEVTGKGGP
ncbi:MAG: DUF4386 domain-containing protein [Spirochaetota bacterium]